jgi:hypothetical protein
LGGGKIAGDGFCTGPGGEIFPRGGERIGGEKLTRLDEPGVDKTPGKRGGHLARAEKSNL